jgi:hypothetical protein
MRPGCSIQPAVRGENGIGVLALSRPRPFNPWLLVLISGLFASLLSATSLQEPAAAGVGSLSPRNANYTIHVELDPDRKMLQGEQTIEWRNQTSATASEIWLHLYYNAWRNNQSTWLKEDSLRSDRDLSALRPEDWGFIELESLRLVTGQQEPDLSAQWRFESPDDGNPEDRTVAVVSLPTPIGPGETVSLQVGWTSKIPRTFRRTGYRGNFFFLAHWFPKVGVFQEDGSWNCHQFHAATEFFSDYGVYDVQITVPTGWLVGATGLNLGTTDNGDDTSTHRFKQEDVHDFAWTTSPDYREARDRFESTNLHPVEMRLLYQPEHEAQVERHFLAAKAALQYYGAWYGQYPYDHITLIDPAYGSGAGGMEYPTLFTCGTRYWNPAGGGRPEGVTVHEAGHQFWYGIVGNNEFEHAWLDEGLNTFSTARTLDVAFGPSSYVARFFKGFVPVIVSELKQSRMTQGNRLDGYRRVARHDTQSTPTFLYYPSSASAISYNKTALWLATLERRLGWDILQQILSTFFERWKFRHPGPEDFFAIADEISGQDLSGFFDQVHRDSVLFDFAVSRFTSQPVTHQGWESAEDSQKQFETQLVVRRLQDGVLPVELLVYFEDGHQVREVWDAGQEWKLFSWIRPGRGDLAIIDPDRKILLDLDYTNNSRLRESKSRLAAGKWASKWMLWLQDYLHTVSHLF